MGRNAPKGFLSILTHEGLFCYHYSASGSRNAPKGFLSILT